MIRRRAASAALVLALLAPSSPSWGQTPAGSMGQGQTPTRSIGQSSAPAAGQVPAIPPGKTPPASQSGVGGAQGQASGQQQQGGKVPMSAASYSQAMEQSEGLYTEMQRPGPGGQVQEAWDKVDADPATAQKRQGVYATQICGDCVYKVRLREMMTTSIMLPEDAVISIPPDLGDPSGFRVQVKTANLIAVRPNAYGVDTNLNVYTKSGAVYAFYLRAEGFNSNHIPDVMVKILGREKPEAIAIPTGLGESARQDKGKPPKLASASAPAGKDFIRNVPLDVSKFHGWRDYKLWGDDDMAKPVVIYRDAFFTYIVYEEKFDSLSLPAPYVTIDGVDERVNSHLEGSTYVIESVEPLITLKNGKRYLCIQYTGETP